MTAPRAVGVHLPFDAVPAVVRDWVSSTLGSPVVSAVDQPRRHVARLRQPPRWLSARATELRDGVAALVEVPADRVTAWLVGIGTHLAWRAHTAVDHNLPTLAAFRRIESARFLAGAARRLGV